MSKRPFLCLGCASFLAALLCSLGSFDGAMVVAGLCILLFLASIVVYFCTKTKTAILLATGAVLVSCLFVVKSAVVVYPQLAFDGQTVSATMRVKESIGNNAYIVRVEDGDLPENTQLCLWLSSEAMAPKAGDIILGNVTLTAAYDGDDDVRAKTVRAGGTYLYAWAAGGSSLVWIDGQDSVPFPDVILNPLREWIHDTLYRYLPYDEAALSEGMMVGEREHLSASVAADFRASGVYHLLAVSGLHLTLLTGVLLKGLEALRMRKVSRVLITMLAVVLFMGLCGFTASVVRAGVTVLIILAATLARRRADGLNSLGLAAFVMLMLDPFCAFDLGWQLSFAATLAMLVLLPVWETEVTQRVADTAPTIAPFARPVSTAIGVSICAALMTQPLTALYFGEFSTVFLPGNLLCVTVSSVLLVLLFAAVLLAGVLPPLAEGLFCLADGLCGWMTLCTSLLASIPYASISLREGFAVVWLLALCPLLVFGYYVQKMRGVWRVTALMLSVLFIGVTFSTVMNSGVGTVKAAATPSPVILVKTGDSAGLILSGGTKTRATVNEMLQSEGVSSLQWVLWLDAEEEAATEPPTLAVPVERWVVGGEPEAYAELARKMNVMPLQEGTILRFSENGTLRFDDDFYYLRLGDTEMLLCPEAGDPTLLDERWRAVDVLFVSSTAPDMSLLAADQVVAFSKYEHIETLCASIPHTVQTVHFTAKGSIAFLTRGLGDMTLRSY